MFAEIRLPIGLPVDRDDVEDAVVEALDGAGEVVGAGTGVYGSNLDVDFDSDVDTRRIAEILSGALASVGVAGASLRVEGDETWILL